MMMMFLCLSACLSVCLTLCDAVHCGAQGRCWVWEKVVPSCS